MSDQEAHLDEEKLAREWFTGLMSIGEHGFPKSCPGCGKVYGSFSELVRRTEHGLQSSGVLQAATEDKQPLVGFFSRCTCGARIQVLFKDRRDRSPEGLRWRETFGEILEAFKARGVSTDVARQELLRALRGLDLESLKKFRDAGMPSAPKKTQS